MNCPNCGHEIKAFTRKRKLSAEQVETARQMRRDEEKVTYIAFKLECSPALISKLTRDISKKRVKRNGA